MTVRFALLGPLEAFNSAGTRLDLGAPKQRAVLAALLLDAGRVVPVDRLVDLVWGENHPPSVLTSLQAYVSNLRRVLRDDEHATTPIVRRHTGYVVDVGAQDLDVRRFATGCEHARDALARRDWAAAVAAAEAAEACWRGPLLADLGDEEWVRVAAAPLEARRNSVARDLVTALIGCGRVDDAADRASRLVDGQPLDERARWVYVMALYRAGRTADALTELRGFERLLADELGLDPGPALRDLQAAILAQAPELDEWPGQAASSPEPRDAPAGDAVEEIMPDDLVGRRHELDTASGPLDAASAGAHRWLLVTGPAGIGKTRFAEEIVRRWVARGGRAVRSACPDDSGTPSLWPVRELLADLGAGPGGDADTALTPPPGTDADSARFAVYGQVRSKIAAAAEAAATLLLLEDVHWADPATARLLIHLAQTNWRAPHGLLFVLTARDGADQRDQEALPAALARSGGSVTVPLPPLSNAEVGELVHQVSGEPIDDAAADDLTGRTGGNPFFVSEYARLPAADRTDGAVPAAVRSVLGLRLRGLGAGVTEMLRAAAVLGDPIDIALLEAICRLDRDELADLLDQAADEYVLTVGAHGSYTFAHALLREEVLARLPQARRQRLHLRAAEAYAAAAAEDAVARRAHHLLAAGPLADATELFAACRAAASAADERWHYLSAAGWWESAAAAAARLPQGSLDVDDVDLVLARIAALARGGRSQTVLDAVDAAIVDALRRGRIDTVGRLAATLLRGSGSWPWTAYGSDPEALLARLAGLQSVVRDDPRAHARVLAALAVGSCYDPDPSVPDRLSRAALDIAETLGDPQILSDALLGRALTFSGVAERAAESIELLDRLAGLEHRGADVDAVIGHGLRYLACTALGRPEAHEQVRRGTLGSDVLRLPTSRVQFRYAEAGRRQFSGRDPDEAERGVAEAYARHRETELYSTGVFELALLVLRWEQGRLAEYPLSEVPAESVPWAAAVVAVARGDGDAERLLADELRRVEPPVWTTHGRLTMLAHAVADLPATAGTAAMAAQLRGRLAPFAPGLANIGQLCIAGTIDLAKARLACALGDLDAAEQHLADSERIAAANDGAGTTLRNRLVALQLAVLRGRQVDPQDAAAVAATAASWGMLGVVRDAQALVEQLDTVTS